jgi:hypothetical protein
VSRLTFWKMVATFFVTGVALRMSFAADQSAPMFPEPMNAEIQLALQKLNVLGRVLCVAANLRCTAI